MLNYSSEEAVLEGVQPEVVIGCFKNALEVDNKLEARVSILESANLVNHMLYSLGTCRGKDSVLCDLQDLSNRKAGLLYLLRNSTGYVKGKAVYLNCIDKWVFGYTYISACEVYVQLEEGGVIYSYQAKGSVVRVPSLAGEAFKCSSGTGSRNRGYKFTSIAGVTISLHSFIYFSTHPEEILHYIIGNKCINHCVTKVVESLYDGRVCYSVKDYEYDSDSLELISNNENVIHGMYVKDYQLNNIYFSAKDIERFIVLKNKHPYLMGSEVCALMYLGTVKEKFFSSKLKSKVRNLVSTGTFKPYQKKSVVQGTHLVDKEVIYLAIV